MMWQENRSVPNLPVNSEKVREFEIVNKSLQKCLTKINKLLSICQMVIILY